jgi:HSP20 family protein
MASYCRNEKRRATFPRFCEENPRRADWQALASPLLCERTRSIPYRRCAAVTPWRPMRELESIQNRMEELFDRLSERFFGPGERERSLWGTEAWMPALESHVEGENLIVKADLPGIDPKEVSISVMGNQLTIEGERKREEKKEEKDYLYRELAYGKFSRTMTLPEGVDTEKIKANYKNGVLEITMPAPKQLGSKKVQIAVQK